MSIAILSQLGMGAGAAGFVVALRQIVWTVHATRDTFKGGRVHRYIMNFATDAEGRATWCFEDGDSLPVGAIIDHITIIADPNSVPTTLWDVRLNEIGGVDLLNGAGENLATTEDSTKVLFDAAGGSATFAPVVVRAPRHELIVSGAGQDASGVIAIYLREPVVRQ